MLSTSKTTVLLLLCLLCGTAFGQHTLVLDKPGRIKRLHYNAGDPLYVKLQNGQKVEGMISKIDSGKIVINEYLVHVTEIDKVYKERPLFSIFSPFFFVGGLIYGGSYLLNDVVFGDGRFLSRRSFWFPTASAVSSGLLMRFLAYRRYKIGRCCEVKTIHLGDFAKPPPKVKNESGQE